MIKMPLFLDFGLIQKPMLAAKPFDDVSMMKGSEKGPSTKNMMWYRKSKRNLGTLNSIAYSLMSTIFYTMLEFRARCIRIFLSLAMVVLVLFCPLPTTGILFEVFDETISLISTPKGFVTLEPLLDLLISTG